VSQTPREEETEPETGESMGQWETRSGAKEGLGLVVLWSADTPEDLGSWLPVAASGAGGARVFGRGPARAEDPYPRLSAFRQRPNHSELLPPFQSSALSRSQLVIRPLDQKTLEVENVGRRKLIVNGAVADRHEVRPGDVLEIGSRLALLCTTRPTRLPGAPIGSGHPFGRADQHGMVGESPHAWQLRSDIAFAARRPGHLLILGATGTGKELAASALHALSARRGPLVARNAATLPESLIDAELFGNPKGYPNPGTPEREGLIGAAHQGTLFLDEFADLPAGAQAHVLRVLDSGDYQRLGESTQRRSEFRLIAATNRPEGSLRADLLARFDFRLRVPELSKRREDVPLLLLHLFATATRDDPELRERYSQANGVPRLAPGFVQRLAQQPLPGNVRDVRHLLWRALAESTNDALEWPTESAATGKNGDRADFPVDRIQEALDANNGSVEKTWRALGLPNRYVLRRLIAKYDLSVTRRSGG
jgi:two-component system, NtrC family, response regulator HydG